MFLSNGAEFRSFLSVIFDSNEKRSDTKMFQNFNHVFFETMFSNIVWITISNELLY